MNTRASQCLVMAIGILFAAAIAATGLPTIDKALAYKTKYSQAESLTNACGNSNLAAFNVLCQNLASEIQGDKNAANIIGTQTGGALIEESTPVKKAILTVIKEVICPINAVCPSPSEFTIEVSGNHPFPPSFAGSSSGTQVKIGSGAYSVSETPPMTPPLLALTQVQSADCSGMINAGESKTCTLTNTYSIIDPAGDDDGDNLLNSWEISGIDENGDGTIDLILPDANPLHKDQYLEIDFMQFHQPITQAVDDVITSFNDAPLTNPNGVPGITLHVLVDEQIAHQPTSDLPDLVNIKNTNFGTAAERADPNAANLIAAKQHVYHYGVFAHDQAANPGSSGRSNGIPGMEFLVTLGAPGWGDPDGDGHPSGSIDQQAGTIMHEFGHNLNLRHGGGDDINCKPNYLSVMSYTRQFSFFIADRPLDYSRSQLAALDESNLNEPDGISTSTPPGLATVYGPTTTGLHSGLADGTPVNWNIDTGDADSTDTGVVSDINDIPAAGCAAGSFHNPGIQVDAGFDDWNTGFVFHTAGLGLPDAFRVEQVEEVPELTIDDVRQSRLLLLDGIKFAIERLQSGEPSVSQEGRFDHIAELLLGDQLSEAVVELNILKDDVIATYGAEAAQREVIPMIDNLILALEKQK